MISETYRDVEIVLLEQENKWRFTVNGRERTTQTIVNARASIDRALDDVKSKKEKPWEPFDAYLLRYSDVVLVKVTSAAEGRGYERNQQFWVSRNGQRSKESATALKAVNERNTALIAEIKRLETQVEQLRHAIQDAKIKLEPLTVPVASDSESPNS